MRKIYLLICLLFVIVLSSCGKQQENISNQEKNRENIEQQVGNDIDKVKQTDVVDTLQKQVKNVKQTKLSLSRIKELIKQGFVDEKMCSEITNIQVKKDCFKKLKQVTERRNSHIYSQQARNNLSFTPCEKLNGQNKDYCIFDVIMLKSTYEKPDIVYCDKLENKEAKTRCKKMLSNYQKALDMKNIDACNKLDFSLQRSCYSKLLSGKIDYKVCEKIKDPMFQRQCFDKYLKDKTTIQDCKTIPQKSFMYQSCLQKVVMDLAKKGIDKCDLLKEDFIKNQCKQTYTINKALKDKSVAICKQTIPKELLQQDEQSLFFCEQNIINQLNQKEKTKKYCDLFTKPLWKYQCKENRF